MVFSYPLRSALILAALSLAACADSSVNLPHVFEGNEVPPEVVAAPRVVPQAAPINRAVWPRLGDVPSKPKDFTPQSVIDAAKDEMANDRDDALRLQQDYQAAPEVLPSR